MKASLRIALLNVSCIFLFFVTIAANAQPNPDAGSILNQQPAPPENIPSPVQPSSPVVEFEGDFDSGPSFQLNGFIIEGENLIPEAELLTQVSLFIGEEVNFAFLEAVASVLTGYYYQEGYVAQVLVPEQEISSGIVELRVLEGIRGNLQIENQGQRVDSARVTEFVNQRLAAGEPLSLTRLDEAMALLNEQPGVSVNTTLQTGDLEREVGLLVGADDEPFINGGVSTNNEGPHGSGGPQVLGLVSLNNPTGNFDALSLLLNASEGSTFGRLDYSLAIGNRGLRIGVATSYLDYEITEDELTALQLQGYASTYEVNATYPLVRRVALGLNVFGSYTQRQLVDGSVLGEVGDREVTATNFGINGYLRHPIGPLGTLTSFSSRLTSGESDQQNAGALLIDNLTRQVNGSYNKLSYDIRNRAQLSQLWDYTLILRGQFADMNLESTERMILGGPLGVRAYPVGEAQGDEGVMLNLNLRRSFSEKLSATVFYDHGSVKQHHSIWTGWNLGAPDLKNRYSLSGMGIAIDWRLLESTLLSASVAVPVSGNPGRDSNDANIDGRENGAYLWFNLSAQF